MSPAEAYARVSPTTLPPITLNLYPYNQTTTPKGDLPMPNPSPEKQHALQWVDQNRKTPLRLPSPILELRRTRLEGVPLRQRLLRPPRIRGLPGRTWIRRNAHRLPRHLRLRRSRYSANLRRVRRRARKLPAARTLSSAAREGLHPWAAGHTDPHSSLGVAVLAGILGAKTAIDSHNLKGTLAIFGEPAEKVCGSKPVHAAKGYYDGFDAFVSYHPHATNTTIWDTHCGSYWSAVFTFECHDPETWVDPDLLAGPNHPHSAPRCPGAVDALCLMYTNTKYTKEAMYPHTGTWTLNEFIMAGGQCTSDNLPPRFSQIQYAWRSPTLEIQQRIFQVLESNARHAAEVTGCDVSIRWVTKTRVGLPNHAMASS